jgi:hypothetical protein
VVEGLSSMFNALGSIPSSHKKKGNLGRGEFNYEIL